MLSSQNPPPIVKHPIPSQRIGYVAGKNNRKYSFDGEPETLLERIQQLAEVCKAGTSWCLDAALDFIRTITRTISSVFTISDKGGVPRDDL